MHKLTILIDTPADWSAFDDGWPDFLHQAERMPRLRREATSRVDAILYGQSAVGMIHELYFETPADTRQALASPPGREARKILQRITEGRMVLFFADPKEDELE